MIHRAPMTKREMTEEDFKYRQGRSKRQADNNEKIMIVIKKFLEIMRLDISKRASGLEHCHY